MLKKSVSTGQIRHGFKRRVPSQKWTMRDELAQPESDSDEDESSDNEEPEEPEEPEESEEPEDDSNDKESTKHRLNRHIYESHDALLTLVDRYDITEQLHKDNFFCFVANDKVYGQCVIKICRRNNHPTKIPKEVRCHVRTEKIPNVLKMLRWHELGYDQYCIVTPFMSDDCISNVFNSNVKIQSYMKQLLTILNQCLQVDLIHRDIKPSNLFWDDNTGILTLTDFDCSTFYRNRVRYYRIGTGGFMSPEMYNGDGYTWKTDVYSCGIVFGMLLYKIDSEYEVIDKPKKWRKNGKRSRKNRSVFYQYSRDLLGMMLSVDPKKRPSYEECLKHRFFQI